MIKNDNIDYDQVALRFAAPVPPRTKSSVTVAALKQKFSSLPAIAQTLDANGDGFLSEGEIAKAMSKAGIIMQLADIRYIYFSSCCIATHFVKMSLGQYWIVLKRTKMGVSACSRSLEQLMCDCESTLSLFVDACLTFIFKFHFNFVIDCLQHSEALASKAPAPTRLETMGLIALSKMLDPAFMLSTVLPSLDKADENKIGSVSKADFNRVLRANITALTVADCEKVTSTATALSLVLFPQLLLSPSLRSGSQSFSVRRSDHQSFHSQILLDYPPPPSFSLRKRGPFHSWARHQQRWRCTCVVMFLSSSGSSSKFLSVYLHGRFEVSF